MIYTGPVRVLLDPEDYSGNISKYEHRGRVNLGLQNGRIRKVERLTDGVVIDTRIYKHEKQIRITIPPKAAPIPVDYGYILTPTSDEATGGWYGDTFKGLKTPLPTANFSLLDDMRKTSLELLDNETKNPINEIVRYEAYKDRIDQDNWFIYAGASSNSQNISWNNVHYSGALDSLELFESLSVNSEPRYNNSGVLLYGFDSGISKYIVNGRVEHYSNAWNVFSFGQHNLLYYRGNAVIMPSSSLENNYAPATLPDGTIVNNLRYAGCYYKNNKLLFIRSAPIFSDSLFKNPLRQEEVCIVDAVKTTDMLSAGTNVTILETFDYGDSETNSDSTSDLVWSDWKFNSDGTQAKAVKGVSTGVGDEVIIYEYTIDIDWDNDSIVWSRVQEDNLVGIDYDFEDQPQRVYKEIVVGVAGDRYIFPWATYEDAFAINYYNLKQGVVLRSILNESRTNLRMVWNTKGEVYNRNGSFFQVGVQHKPNPIIEQHDNTTLFAYSHTTGLSGFPLESYNSNTELLSAAGLTGKSNPALNPMYRI